MDYPQHDIEVSYFDDKGQGNNIVYLINFAHTERDNFQVVNQWTFVEYPEKQADIIIFIHGLSLVVMELKCKHSKKCTFYTLRFGCSFAAVNTIKPQLL